MRLAYVDIQARNRLMILPRAKGETRLAYCERFQREIRGLGRVFIVTVKGASAPRVRAVRSW